MSTATKEKRAAIISESLPIVITKAALVFVAKALSRDSNREALQYAYLQSNEYGLWLVATDTHRMHVVRISGEKIPVGMFIDIHRLLLELRFSRGTGVQIDKESVDILSGQGNLVGHVFAPCLNTLVGKKYPDWQMVVPKYAEVKDDNFNGASFNFNFLADATSISKSYRVFIHAQNESRPAVLTENKGDCWSQDWFAVIMPMTPDPGK